MTKLRQPHILVIDPAVKFPELDTFNRLSQTSPLPLTYHLPALFGLSSLEKVGDTTVKGIVILGSLSSVNDGLSWQKELGNYLRKHFEKKTPVLGLCFGHQLIAHLFGGKVDYVFPDQTKHLGFRTVSLKANRLWGNSCEGDLYVSHCEHVVVAPAGFSVIATSQAIPIGGLAHETLPIWTFQPHPEAGPKFFEVREKREAPDPTRFHFGHQIVDRFLHFCAEQ